MRVYRCRGYTELERIDTVAGISGHNALAYLRSADAIHDATERFQTAFTEGSVSASNKNYAVRQRERNSKRAESSARRNVEANFVTCRCKFVSTRQDNAQQG